MSKRYSTVLAVFAGALALGGCDDHGHDHEHGSRHRRRPELRFARRRPRRVDQPLIMGIFDKPRDVVAVFFKAVTPWITFKSTIRKGCNLRSGRHLGQGYKRLIKNIRFCLNTCDIPTHLVH